MPSEFREKFLDGFSIELLKEYADISYIPCQYGENEKLHLNHSCKLVLKGRNLHRIGGPAVIDELITLAKGAENLAAEGNKNLVRFNIAKSTHYIIDLATYPHVNEGVWDKYHSKFEDISADWLEAHKSIIENLVSNYTPNPMKSIPNRVRSITEEAFFDSIDFLPAFKRKCMVTDLQLANMCCKQIYNLMDWFATFEKLL